MLAFLQVFSHNARRVGFILVGWFLSKVLIEVNPVNYTNARYRRERALIQYTSCDLCSIR